MVYFKVADYFKIKLFCWLFLRFVVDSASSSSSSKMLLFIYFVFTFDFFSSFLSIIFPPMLQLFALEPAWTAHSHLYNSVKKQTNRIQNTFVGFCLDGCNKHTHTIIMILSLFLLWMLCKYLLLIYSICTKQKRNKKQFFNIKKWKRNELFFLVVFGCNFQIGIRSKKKT